MASSIYVAAALWMEGYPEGHPHCLCRCGRICTGNLYIVMAPLLYVKVEKGVALQVLPGH
jgi:hypothetical protein